MWASRLAKKSCRSTSGRNCSARAGSENFSLSPAARFALLAGVFAQATPIFATGGEELSNGEKTPWNWWQLNYTGNPSQRSPFWIVQVPREILNGHGDIFNP